ncbi:hypothetical protein [Schaalia vaccimaxillae]|uniref:hypothetical protein n=1 Tax=Schaalia vaccimaxillae TaxID=183916 RepID=UPI0003B7604C|nr:hypothetical protein [Schaalia vaccimaxillae]
MNSNTDQKIALAALADHLDDAHLALLTAADLIDPGDSGYRLSAWQAQVLSHIVNSAKLIRQARTRVVTALVEENHHE